MILSDREKMVIEEAFHREIEGLVGNFVDGLISSETDEQAVEAFQKGLDIIRRAKSLIIKN